MQHHDRREEGNPESTTSAGGAGWLDGMIAGFMSEELADAVDAAVDADPNAEAGESPRAWVAEGRARIDDTMASLLAPIIRKAMEEASDDVAARLERIEARLEAIERLLTDR